MRLGPAVDGTNKKQITWICQDKMAKDKYQYHGTKIGGLRCLQQKTLGL